jgi:hypothetical protein
MWLLIKVFDKSPDKVEVWMQEHKADRADRSASKLSHKAAARLISSLVVGWNCCFLPTWASLSDGSDGSLFPPWQDI